jgi:hypothetical protein
LPGPEVTPLPAVPALPAQTRIVVEQPEPDRLCLRWPPDPGRKADRGGWLALPRRLWGFLQWLFAFVIWLAILLLLGLIWFSGMVQLLSGGGGQPGFGAVVAVLGVFFFSWTLIGVLGVGRDVWHLVVGDRPEGLTLTPGAVLHEPGRSDLLDWVVPGQRGQPWRFGSGQVRLIRRSELGAVRLDRVPGRQRLTIDCGVERVEVGRGLAEPEREWLADLLRAWAGPAPVPSQREERHAQCIP